MSQYLIEFGVMTRANKFSRVLIIAGVYYLPVWVERKEGKGHYFFLLTFVAQKGGEQI